MNSIKTVAGKRDTSVPLDTYALNESKLMRETAAFFLDNQKGTVTQTYASDVSRMYLTALNGIHPTERALRDVLSKFLDAHLDFVDLVDPTRFDCTFTPTVENEWCLTRTATIGGRVKLVMDEDLITFSYLPAQRDPAAEILTFHNPEDLAARDYISLLRRFFEL